MAEEELEHAEGETAEPVEAAESPEDHEESGSAGSEDAEADVPAEDEEPAATLQLEAPAGPEKHWYIIHAYSGFEQKVAESLRTRAEAFRFLPIALVNY